MSEEKYCKCCNRHISAMQFTNHRSSKKCLENHAKKCIRDNHRKDITSTIK